jgi:putative ABC transport system substrate-binding protein
MERRVFLAIASAGLLAAPLSAEAQGGKLWRIGVLAPGPSAGTGFPALLRQSLRDLGYVEGLNLAIEWRDAREYADAGDLLSFWANYADLFRRVASYVDRILKGAKPADLPIEQPTRFELIINLKTAKALGLTIPSSLLRRADDVIQ